MRTPITLKEFLFTLNQDEDMLVKIIDYERESTIIERYWKSDLSRLEVYEEHKDWFVQDFITTIEGLEITIVELEAELD